MTASALIEVSHLSKSYQLSEEQELVAVKDVSFEINEGEFVGLVGHSGSGKSTLLHLLGGLDHPTTGSVVYEGQDLSLLTRPALAEFRLYNIGFVFQAYNLLPVLTAQENVEFVLQLQHIPREVRKRRASSVLKQLGISAHADRLPNCLSGGQQQRVAVARALVTRPKVILADEPTANLDSTTTMELLEIFRELNSRLGMTIVISTHDPRVMKICNRRILLSDGRMAGEQL